MIFEATGAHGNAMIQAEVDVLFLVLAAEVAVAVGVIGANTDADIGGALCYCGLNAVMGLVEKPGGMCNVKGTRGTLGLGATLHRHVFKVSANLHLFILIRKLLYRAFI